MRFGHQVSPHGGNLHNLLMILALGGLQANSRYFLPAADFTD